MQAEWKGLQASVGHAAVWFLNTAVVDLYPPTTTTTNATDLSEESVFDDDGRSPVKAVHFRDGGKFRSIVKVRVQFPNGQWYMGTGYLVKEGIVVTAAHNVYHKTRGFAIQIMCYIGYNGPQSVQAVEVQLRHGRKVVTMESWLNESSPCHDVAFIQTDAPFTGNLNPFEFIDTPSSITGLLGVVGYPSDKDLDGKKGAQMYKLFQRTTYDLRSSGMISYRTSTFGGQSGSPILLKTRNGKFVVIGTHNYGGESTNLGSSIGGNSGNNYKALLKLAQGEEPRTAKLNKVMIVPL
ncbi:trypsin-like cysteine/serine peptidase domain-containing protein [Mycena olivaceomarginata]|nr:trypsin-like cysteine/serine peptidase domain-containing protein [Mycena olivaceomarginata]